MGQFMISVDTDTLRSTRLKTISNQNQINSKGSFGDFGGCLPNTGRPRQNVEQLNSNNPNGSINEFSGYRHAQVYQT